MKSISLLVFLAVPRLVFSVPVNENELTESEIDPSANMACTPQDWETVDSVLDNDAFWLNYNHDEYTENGMVNPETTDSVHMDMMAISHHDERTSNEDLTDKLEKDEFITEDLVVPRAKRSERNSKPNTTWGDGYLDSEANEEINCENVGTEDDGLQCDNLVTQPPLKRQRWTE